MIKTLVLYVFHEYNSRVAHFLKNCIFDDPSVDFLIICNNKNIQFEVPIYVKKINRDNIGYCFGGWSEGLLTNNLYENYDKFIFVNSSAVGPFLSSDFKGKWTDIYINGLNDSVKLFGSTINTIKDPLKLSHVQSYIFSLDRDALELLIHNNIFSITNYAKDKAEAISNKEILMSRIIIQFGWNIGCLDKRYKDVDFTFSSKLPRDYNIEFLDDIMYEEYRNKLWNEYDLIFIKGNRVNIEI